MSRHRGAKPPVDVNSWGRSACYPRRTFYPLSDGPSMQNHRITKPCFRPCSTCCLAVKAPLCLCTPADYQPRWGTFGASVTLWEATAPDQTTRLTLFPWPDNGSGLESIFQGWYFRMAPPSWPWFQSLPPILHMKASDPISGYSKGARGLSVQSRVTGIFTVLQFRRVSLETVSRSLRHSCRSELTRQGISLP